MSRDMNRLLVGLIKVFPFVSSIVYYILPAVGATLALKEFTLKTSPDANISKGGNDVDSYEFNAKFGAHFLSRHYHLAFYLH